MQDDGPYDLLSLLPSACVCKTETERDKEQENYTVDLGDIPGRFEQTVNVMF